MHAAQGLGAVFREIAGTDNVSYLLTDELRILRTNGAWDRFARDNNGEAMLARWGRGACVLDAIASPLQPFYANGFRRTRETGVVWEHDYECSTATRHRTYRMYAYPFNGALLVTHALRDARPHPQATAAPSPAHVNDGLVLMCAHCRRVKRWSTPPAWDWVPSFVAEPRSNISHGLCQACQHHYFPDAMQGA